MLNDQILEDVLKWVFLYIGAVTLILICAGMYFAKSKAVKMTTAVINLYENLYQISRELKD